MAMVCPECGGTDVAAGLSDTTQCLSCAALFDSKGGKVEVGPDQTTRDVAMARLAPRTQHVVGNLADLQRLGAEKAVDPKDDNFVLPAGVDPKRVPKHGVEAGAVVPGGLPGPGDPDDAAASGPPATNVGEGDPVEPVKASRSHTSRNK